MVRNAVDAAIQEAKSIGIFSGILTLLTRALKEGGANDMFGMVISYVATIIGDIMWQFRDNDHQQEIHTVTKQLSRIGINLVVLVCATFVNGILFLITGFKGSDMNDLSSKKSELWSLIYGYVGNTGFYTLVRLVMNLFLLVPAFANLFNGIGD